MTLGSQIAWDDTILPFQLDRSDIRGRVARLDGVLDAVLSQHAYPPVIETLVAEAALLTAPIGQTIKLRWKLSLQIRGDGPVGCAERLGGCCNDDGVRIPRWPRTHVTDQEAVEKVLRMPGRRHPLQGGAWKRRRIRGFGEAFRCRPGVEDVVMAPNDTFRTVS